jgi:uridylate kinase
MNAKSNVIFRRILLKLSGEALVNNGGFGIDQNALDNICSVVKSVTSLGVEVGIVIGGGNLFRGETLSATGFDRVTCDQVGMLATVMNGLILRDSFLNAGMPANLLSSIAMQGVVETYNRSRAVDYLTQKHVVIFAAGTGCPLFSTDSAASLRGIEIGADIILKATKVDGVYSADPKLDKNAKFYSRLTYQQVLEQQLRVMDAAAIALCRDHNMPLRIFNMNKPDILRHIVTGVDEGTLIED